MTGSTEDTPSIVAVPVVGSAEAGVWVERWLPVRGSHIRQQDVTTPGGAPARHMRDAQGNEFMARMTLWNNSGWALLGSNRECWPVEYSIGRVPADGALGRQDETPAES